MSTLSEKVEDIFSYSGRIGRAKYVTYGFIIPWTLLVVSALISGRIEGNQFNPNLSLGNAIGDLLFLLSLPVALSLALSSMIRRARDTTFSTSLGVASYFLLSYLGMFLLAIAPSYKGESKPDSSKMGKAIAAIYVIIIIGIVAAVTISAFTPHSFFNQPT